LADGRPGYSGPVTHQEKRSAPGRGPDVGAGLLGTVDVDDPEAVAEAAGLAYVHDTAPGITRHRAGKGFRYVRADGSPVTDPRTKDRIRALVIPPAWQHVWICARANGHLQATGWDIRGRKQYRYHDGWRAIRDATKFERLLDFGAVLPEIRARAESDVARRGLPREKVVAVVVELLDRTLIRIGNEEYAQANDSYGLTTLRDQHATFSGGSATLTFRAKGGQNREQRIDDRRLARIIRQCQELPGQILFQYRDDDGEPRAIDSRDVNTWLDDVAPGGFTAKDFRTWGATVRVAAALHPLGPPESSAAARRHLVEAVKAAAEHLANTPTVCRNSYVHPGIIEAYHDGSLCEISERDIRRMEARRSGLSRNEALLVVALQRRQAASIEEAQESVA
jgi:DNA topoisomerase I